VAISGVKGSISTDLLRAIHQTIGIIRNINAPRVPPIIAAKWFVVCVGAVDVPGVVAEDVLEEDVLEDNVLEEDVLEDDVLEEDVLEEDVLEEDVVEEDVLVAVEGTAIPDAISSATMGSKDG
jgi:hypothetical protein